MPFCGILWLALSSSPFAAPTQWVFIQRFGYVVELLTFSLIGIRRFIQDLERDAIIYERQRFGSSAPLNGLLALKYLTVNFFFLKGM